jgi:hypothetical protein
MYRFFLIFLHNYANIGADNRIGAIFDDVSVRLNSADTISGIYRQGSSFADPITDTAKSRRYRIGSSPRTSLEAHFKFCLSMLTTGLGAFLIPNFIFHSQELVYKPTLTSNSPFQSQCLPSRPTMVNTYHVVTGNRQ